jgi:PTH2 family peptidyl-tRNA hydrolase
MSERLDAHDMPAQEPAPQPGPDDELRVYIIVRKDAGYHMSKPKFGVQCAHAILMLYTEVLKIDPARALRYIENSQPKIILECRDMEQLLNLFEKSVQAGFYAETVTDLGRTEFGKPTMTALAVGPVWHLMEARESFLKRLRLYRDEHWERQVLGQIEQQVLDR